MDRRKNICVILFIYFFCYFCQANDNIAYNIPDPDCTGAFNLCTDLDKDRLGREAVRTIHEQMDDDKDGKIEVTESQDFIKEELESKTDAVRYRRFQSADLEITFDDLWIQWEKSVVFNWTTDDVIAWLVNHVNLPMYVDNFRRNQFDGRMIPRIATNTKQYLSAIMQIRDPRHKRRFIIKATDVVLFGPPQRTHSLIKDMILMSAVLISFGACLYAFMRHRRTQENMKVMLKELETLQKAEGDLVSVTGKMKALEYELKDKSKVDRGLLNSWFIEVQRTKDEAEKFRRRRGSTIDIEKQLRLSLQEIEQLRIALRKAEEHAQHQSYDPPSELIDLLKRTYLIEEAAFEINRKTAESAMLTAKEQMNKISKMQKGFFGAVRIAHTGCIDNISELIDAAKERLADVQDEYEERERRWNRIAALLDREDLGSNSSSSTNSIGTNQYLTGTPTSSLANGNVIPSVFRIRDAYSRSKQPSFDSNNLINSTNDPPSIYKSNSNLNNRVNASNPLFSIRTSSQDLLNRIDNGSDSPASIVKRRTYTNNTLHSNTLSSSDHLSLNPKLLYSRSANDLNNSNEVSANHPDESLDVTPVNSPTKPVFDLNSDLQMDGTDSLYDEQDRRSQLSGSAFDDQQSVTSPERKRKTLMSSRLLKPFQNIRLRKKSNAS